MSQNIPVFTPPPSGRPLKVAAFMSGSGTNVIKLLGEQAGSGYEIAFIFSDRQDDVCRGQKIARRFGVPYFSFDIRRFHNKRDVKRTVATPEGLAARREFDQVAAKLVEAFEVDVIALGGYMSFLTLPCGVNVHPADLSLVNETGQRLFVGDDAVYDAVRAGQNELRASTLWIDQGVDSGPLLMVSDPVAVELPAPLEELKHNPERLRTISDEHQERLKQAGDWVIFPLTLKLMAGGRLAIGPDGVATLDGEPRPLGVRPGEI